MRIKKEESKSAPPQLAHWIELKMPENIDISSWRNPDGSFNVEKMQKETKESITEAHRKRQEWQKRAILDSLPCG